MAHLGAWPLGAVTRADRDADRVDLEVRGRSGKWVCVWAVVGPGDDLRPVQTAMLEGED